MQLYDNCPRCNSTSFLNLKANNLPSFCTKCNYTASLWTDYHYCIYCQLNMAQKYKSGLWCQKCDNIFSICFNCSSISDLICNGFDGKLRQETLHKKLYETRLLHNFLETNLTCLYQCRHCKNVFLT